MRRTVAFVVVAEMARRLDILGEPKTTARDLPRGVSLAVDSQCCAAHAREASATCREVRQACRQAVARHADLHGAFQISQPAIFLEGCQTDQRIQVHVLA